MPPMAEHQDKDTNPAGERPQGTRLGESAADPARTMPTRSTSDPAQTRAFAEKAAQILADDKCEDVLVLDVRGLSQMTDYIIIGSGTSDRQMRSAMDDVAEESAALGYEPVQSADDRGVWLVADFVDIVVHLFEPNTRAHYDLEMLWGDAEHVDWSREGSIDQRNKAGLTPDERATLRDSDQQD